MKANNATNTSLENKFSFKSSGFFYEEKADFCFSIREGILDF